MNFQNFQNRQNKMKKFLLILSLLWSIFAIGQTTIPTDTYLDFPLDGNAKDVSSNKFEGKIIGTGVTPTSDRFGNTTGAMAFDGVSFIDIPYAESMGTNDFAVSFWAWYDPANKGYVFTKDQACIGDNQFRIGGTGNDANEFQSSIIAYTPTTSVWSHIVYVRKGSLCSYYVNGVFVKSAAMATTAFSNTLHFRIGAVYPCTQTIDPLQTGTNPSTVFKGKVDDLKMFKHALTELEINALYKQNSLIAWYKMDNSGADSSGNKIDVTPTNISGTTDRFGKPNSAIKFGGLTSPSSLDVTNPSLDITTGSFTFSTWLNLNSLSGMDGNSNSSTAGNHTIYAKSGDGTKGATLLLSPTGIYYLSSKNTITTELTKNTTYVPNLINNWSHVALVVTPTNVKIYVNNTIVYEATGSFPVTAMNGNGLSFGRFFDKSYYPLNGSLDDIKMFNRELSKDEISALYTQNNYIPQNALNLANAATTTTQYAQVPAGTWFNANKSSDFTVDSWVYLNDYKEGNWIRLFDFGNFSAGTGYDNILFGLSSPNGKAAISIRSGTTANDMFCERIPLNKWTHVAITMKGDSAYVYYNGVQVLKTFSSLKALAVNRLYNYIGKSNWAEPFTNMLVDEFRIYNKYVSQSDLIERSHHSLKGDEDGLILYYDFNQANGTTVPNLAKATTAAAGNATLYSAPAFSPSVALLTPFVRSATSIYATGFTANWDAVPSATSYEIEYSAIADFSTSTKLTQATANPLVITCNYSPVYFRVRALTETQTSEWSATANYSLPGSALRMISGQYVQLPTITNLSETFSVDEWVNVKSITSNYVSLFSLGNADMSNTLFLLYRQTGTLETWLYKNGTVTILNSTNGKASKALQLDQWMHVAMNVKGDSVFVFLNGENVQAIKMSEKFVSGLRNTNYIGRAPYATLGSTDIMNAVLSVDEFRLYNGINLTKAEIIERSHKKNIGNEASLALYYDFDQSNPNTVQNLVTSNNDATIFNGAVAVESKALITPFIRPSTSVTGTSFTANWDKVPYATKYEIQYTGSVSKTLFATTNSIKLDSLSDGTAYSCKVRAITPTQTSEWSTSTTTTLLVPPGNAIALNATSSVQLPLVTKLIDNISISSWIYWKGANTANQFIVLNGNTGNAGYGIYIDVNNKISGICSGNNYLPSNQTLTTNAWQHVALVRNSGIWSLYLNGNAISISNNTTTPNIPIGATYIGADELGTEKFNGLIDEVSFWNKALSATEIAALTHLPFNESQIKTGLISYFDFNQFTGTNVFENVSKTNIGTFTGTPTFVNSQALLTPFIRTATDVKGTSFIAHWDSIPSATKYEIEYSSSSLNSKTVSTKKCSIQLDSLLDGTSYTYKVRAITPTETSEWNTATITSTLVPPGNALSLSNATSQFATIPSLSFPTSNVTIEGWVYLTDPTTAWYRFFDFGGLSGSSDNNLIFTINNTQASLHTYNGTGVNNPINIATPLELNKWTHIAAIYNGTQVSVYYNGKLVGSLTLKSPLPINAIRASNFIGKSNYTGNTYSTMQVDEFRVYNEALSIDTLIARSHNHLTGKESGLMVYYDFDQLNGTTVNDLSGNKNNALLSNAPLFTNSKALIRPFTRNASAITENSFTAKWDSIPNATYQIQRSLNRAFTLDTISIKSKINSAKITYPIAGMKLYYRVKAITQTETSDWAIDSVQCTQTSPGNAITINGTDENVLISTASPYQSFMFWAKIPAGQTSPRYLFDLRNSDGTGLNTYLYDNGNGYSNIYINGVKQTTAQSINTLPKNQWFNVYVELPTIATTTNIRLLSRCSNTEFLAGSVDEVSVWNKTLSQSEITKYMHNSPASTSTGLVAYYNFENSIGSTLSDASGKGIVATLTNCDYTNSVQSKALITPFIKLASNIAKDSYTAHWEKIANATSYQIQNSIKPDFSIGDTLSVSDTLKTISGLIEATTYNYRVRAITAIDTSEWSTAVINSGMTLPGNALTINGNNIVNCQLSSQFPSTFTIETWLAPNATCLNGAFHAFLGGGAPSVPAMYVYGNQLHWKLYNASTSLTISAVIPGFFEKADEWVHVSIVCDGTSVRAYKNGILMNTTTIVQPFSLSPQQIFTIGQYDNTFNGEIDEFRIWSIAKTEQQINATLHTTLTGKESGLVAYYNFDQTQGNTLPDITGKNIAGTFIQVSPSWVKSQAIIASTIKPAKNISETGFTANWDKVPNMQYQIQLSSTVDFTNAKIESVSDTSKTFTALQAGTKYTFRVRSVSTKDTSDWSTSSVVTPSPAPGKTLSLNGVNQYAQVPSGAWFGSEFTVDSWVYLTNITPYYRLFDFGNGTPSDNILFSPSRNLLSIYKGATGATLQLTKSIPANQWTHVAITFKAGTAKIYYNGILVGQQTGMPIPSGIVTSQNYIGKSNWNEATASAQYDEFHIYNYALSQDSIIAQSHRELKSNEPGLLLNYDFNSYNGFTIEDKLPSKQNAILAFAPELVNSKAMITPFIRKVDTVIVSKTVNSIKLTWDNVRIAKEYKLQVATNFDFSNIVSDKTITDTTASIAIDGKQFGYFYRVQAKTATAVESEWVSGLFIDASVTAPNNAYSNATTVSIPFSTELKLVGSQNLTMSAWIKIPDNTSSYYIFSQVGATQGQVGRYFFINNGKLVLNQDANSVPVGGGWQSFTCPIVISPNVWNHVGYTQENKKVVMYINGSKCIPTSDYSGIAGDNTLRDAQYAATVSTNQGYVGGNVNSSIDDFQIWNSALSQNDISKYAHSGVIGMETNLSIAYDFNQINGSIVKDLASTVSTNGTVIDDYKAWTKSKAQLTPFMRLASSITDSSFTANWDAIPNAIKYLVKYSLDTALSKVVAKTSLTNSLEAKQLMAATKYYFAVQSIIGTDSSEWSPKMVYSTSSLTDSLIAYYPFTNNVNDASGHNANGTIVSSTTQLVTPTTDRFGKAASAYNFNGGYINCGDVNDLDGSYTITSWVNQNDLDANGKSIIAKHHWSGAHISGYILGLNNTGTIAYSAGNGLAHVQNTVDTAIAQKQWQFLCMKYSAPDSVMNIYLNDSLVSSKKGIPPSNANSDNFQIGLWNGGEQKHRFLGSIDDIRIFRRSLSDNEVIRLYHENGWPYTGVKLDVANNNFKEQQSIGSKVGIIKTIKADKAVDTSKVFSYILIGGDGSSDNAKFSIKNDSVLYSNYIFDINQQTTASIRLRGTNLAGVSFDRILTINIVDASITDVYDFNALTLGNIGSQDGWKTSLWSTTSDIQVKKSSKDSTYAMYFNQSGPGVGADASNKLSTLFKKVKFDDLSANYTLAYEIQSACWGTEIGFAYDTTKTGVTKNDKGKKALTLLSSTGCSSESLNLPDNTNLPTTVNIPNEWVRVEMTISNITKNSAIVSVRSRSLANKNSSWIQNQNSTVIAIDTTANNNTNPKLWNTLFVHIEGAEGIVDNIAFSKRKLNENLSTVNDGLIAHYNMDNNMRDTSGNSLHGSAGSNLAYIAPTPTTDRFGNSNAAYDFSAATSFTVANFGLKVPKDEITISLWAKSINYSGSSVFVLNPDDPANRLNAHIRWNTSLYWDFGNISTTGRIYTTNTPAINNVWEHYVFVSSKDSNYMKVYLNDKLILNANTHATLNTDLLKATSLLIGGNATTGNYYGSLDDIRIYNRILSQSEIENIYTEGGWPVQQITLPSSLTIKAGKTLQLPVTVAPAGSPINGLVYSVANSSIATIDGNGLITAKTDGTTLVTVTTSNGSVSATSILTVTDQYIPILTMDIKDTALTVIKGNTKKLAFTYTPKKATSSGIHWWSSDSSIASVSSIGLVSTVAKGKAWIYIASDSTNKVKDSCKFTVLPSAIPELTANDTAQYSIKALTQTNGVWDVKDTLKITIPLFFNDDDPLTYSLYPLSSPNDTLQTLLKNDVLYVYQLKTDTISKPLMVSITATDKDTQSVVKYVKITLKSTPDKAPVIDAIPVIDTLLQFRKTATIDLKKFVHDDYTPFDQLTFDSLIINKRDTISINKGIATIEARPGKLKAYTDSVIIRVVDGKKQTSRLKFYYSYKWVNNLAPTFAKIDTLRQISDTVITINVSKYVKDDYTPTSKLKWSVDKASNANVTLTGTQLEVFASSSAWNGTENIIVRAEDEAGSIGVFTIPFKQTIDLMLSGTPNVDFTLWENDGTTALPTIISRGSKVRAKIIDKSGKTIAYNTWSWNFMGANPNFVNGDVNVGVQYDSVGLFSIKLTAGNNIGKTFVTRNNAVNVVGIKASKKHICLDSTTVLSASDSTAGNLYNWSTGATTASIKVKPTKNTIYKLTLTKDGFSVSDEIEVVVTTPINNIANDTSLCSGQTKEIKPIGFAKILWNGSTTPATSYVTTKAETITAEAWVSSVCPSIKDVLKVTENKVGNIGLPAVLNICQGTSDTLVATGGINYEWNDGITKNDSIIVANSGTFIVTVTGSNGCKASDTTEVKLNSLPTVLAKSDKNNVCVDSKVTLHGEGAASYKWNNGVNDNSPFAVKTSKTYTVTGTSSFGCSSTQSIIVDVRKTFAEQIKVTSYNEANTGIIIAWTPTKGKGTAGYELQRLNDTTGTFKTIAVRGVDDSTYYVDKSADATIKAYSYKLVSTDSACNVTAESTIHKTIHLTPSQSTNESTEVNLNWNTYKGITVTKYKIYVINNGFTIDTLYASDATGAESLSQTYKKHQKGYKYRIAFDLPDSVFVGKLKSDSGPYSQSLSNMAESELVGFPIIDAQFDVTLYPVPANNELHIKTDVEITGYEIYDILGQTVQKGQYSNATIDITNLKVGLYEIVIHSKDLTSKARFVKE